MLFTLRSIVEYKEPFTGPIVTHEFKDLVSKVMGDEFSTAYVFELWVPERFWNYLKKQHPNQIQPITEHTCKVNGLFTKKLDNTDRTWYLSAWLTSDLTKTTADLEEQ